MNNKRRTVISLPNVQKALASPMQSVFQLSDGVRILGIQKVDGLAIPLVVEVNPMGVILRGQLGESHPIDAFSGWVTDDAKRF